jgi:hypothetical protein
MSAHQGGAGAGRLHTGRRRLAATALAGALGLAGASGPSWAQAPIATAVGGDTASGAADSVAGGGASSAAAIEVAAMQAAAPQGATAVAYVLPAGKPAFTAMEAHDALFAAFGAVGGVAMALNEMSEGAKIVNDNGIDDPGPSIGKAIATHLAEASHGPVITLSVDPKHHAVSDLAAAGGSAHARYVVVAGTMMWGIVYYAADLTHFHVTYFAALDLIDTQSGAVITKAKCNYHPVKAEEYSTKTELMANRAAALKAQMQHAADHCAGEFLAKLPKI